jgi:hypothetical protein
MKKLLIVLMLASAQVHAEGYADAVRLQKRCDTLGVLAVYGFKERKKGMGYEKFLARYESSGEDIREAKFNGYLADSEHDAYMKTWADCMDKYGTKPTE